MLLFDFIGAYHDFQTCLVKWFRDVITGMRAIFNLQYPSRDVAQDAAVNCLRNFKNTHKPEGEAGDEKSVGGSLHVMDLLQLIQDNHTISKFTDTAMSLCIPPQVRKSSYGFHA